MMEKLQLATRKFDAPTRRGIFCFSMQGANIGSGEMNNSMNRKAIAETRADTIEPTTVGLPHCDSHRYQRAMNKQDHDDQTHRQVLVVTFTEEKENRSDLEVKNMSCRRRRDAVVFRPTKSIIVALPP